MKLLLVLLLVPDLVLSNTDAGSTKLTKYRAHKAVKSADQNQDGHADQSEFHAHLRQDMAQKHPRLKSGAAEMAESIDSSFAVLDSDHNGIVSKAEATAAKNSYGHRKLHLILGVFWNTCKLIILLTSLHTPSLSCCRLFGSVECYRRKW